MYVYKKSMYMYIWKKFCFESIEGVYVIYRGFDTPMYNKSHDSFKDTAHMIHFLKQKRSPKKKKRFSTPKGSHS